MNERVQHSDPSNQINVHQNKPRNNSLKMLITAFLQDDSQKCVPQMNVNHNNDIKRG